MMSQTSPTLTLHGDLPVELYGLPLREWQGRAWRSAGAEVQEESADAAMVASAGWVLSKGLLLALVQQPGAALVERTAAGDAKLVAAHCTTDEQRRVALEALDAPSADEAALQAVGLTPQNAEELAGRYNHQLRKRETPYAIDLLSEGVPQAEKELFKSSYKGVTDFVTKYAWPVPARYVTKWCAKAKLTPNMVTTASLVLVILAFWFFWQGQFALGFISGWAMTFLDTVDGKLARTTMQSSEWGNVFDHGIDLIHPPFWYWAWYVGLQKLGYGAPWLDEALWVILVGYVLGRVIEGIFMRVHGFHIHVWKPMDSFMREITARRNPNTFIFMVMAIIGLPVLGFGLVAVWTIVCTLFHLVRLVQAGTQKKTSWLEA
ncbi:CDP-alcohol phosphatidyltransferase family protein [Parvularcula maris]|uniref:CDP-alcohol phosphatidyltransferase family protein n=1 Tax=Parvularcula maris TaxID=2965077 RepID=A0A9X2LBA5_9PROT|nr:CDP-alcohol phosphatidyltransferase family protein [Parvularcula maris]MCQ8186324.1 CDP-alcohol phosphatidyltransferase family protein [Parvularcula maris]